MDVFRTNQLSVIFFFVLKEQKQQKTTENEKLYRRRLVSFLKRPRRKKNPRPKSTIPSKRPVSFSMKSIPEVFNV